MDNRFFYWHTLAYREETIDTRQEVCVLLGLKEKSVLKDFMANNWYCNNLTEEEFFTLFLKSLGITPDEKYLYTSYHLQYLC